MPETFIVSRKKDQLDISKFPLIFPGNNCFNAPEAIFRFIANFVRSPSSRLCILPDGKLGGKALNNRPGIFIYFHFNKNVSGC